MTLPATQAVLPVLLILGPLFAAVAVPWLGRRSARLADAWTALAAGFALCGSAVLLEQVLSRGWVTAEMPLLLGRLEFAADAFGAVFAVFGAFVWLCATLYSFSYLEDGASRYRYHAASLVALGAYLGVVLAGSLLTLFVFFELLGLVAFLLVIHTGKPEARAAAIQYLWMTVLGGVALLAGILLVYAAGDGALGPWAGAVDRESPRVAAALLMVIGFGVKAGMLPVHIWLPNAHPAAPSPASALLSGVIIKAGAYGIFRSVFSLFRPEPGAELAGAAWQFTSQLGLLVLWLGLATMAFGVVLALGQRNAKRMLAYHSISQMGFILAGLGAGAFLGSEGDMGTAGGLLHAVNHALFKATLFLGVGAVALRTGQLDMYALGGLWRRMPVTFALMLVAAAGITGVPLFNGFASKCMIHHALEAAYAREQAASLWFAQWLYVLVCAGTAASFIKLIGLTFLGKARPPDAARAGEAPTSMLVAMGLLCVPIVVLGLWPGLLLERVLAPGLVASVMPTAGLSAFLGHHFLSAGDLGMAAVMLVLGAAIYVIGMRFDLFHLRSPPWLSLERVYERAAHALLATVTAAAPAQQRLLETGSRRTEDSRRRLLVGLRGLGRQRRRLADTLFTGAPGTGEQQFVEEAWLALDAERHAMVRAAVSAALQRVREPGRLKPREREPVAEAVRAIAGLVAGMLFNARMSVVEELTRAGYAAVLAPVLHDVIGKLRPARAEVTEAATQLAHRRWGGEDIAPLLVDVVRPILEEERFESRLRAAAGLPGAAEVAGELTVGGREAVGGPGAFAAHAGHPAHALAGVFRWLVDVLRLGVVLLRQPMSTWPYSEHLDTDRTVVATRRWIERYVRDPGLNILVTYLFFLLVVALLASGSGSA